MRIDRYMTPAEAQKWWRDNGGGRNVPPKKDHDWTPRHGTKQELYRLKKRIPADRVVEVIRTSGETLYPFEAGKVRELSDIGWLRLASFYGILVKSVRVSRKTVLWSRYEEEYGKLSREPEHRRIRMAARNVIVSHDLARDKKAKLKGGAMVEKPRQYYRQASVCTGGIY